MPSSNSKRRRVVESTSDPYALGAEAAWAGGTEELNPYDVDLDADNAVLWLAGFRDARADARTVA